LARIQKHAAAMHYFFRRMALRQSALPAFVALLLLFQSGLAGLANGAAGSSFGLLAQICATDQAGQSNDSSTPASHHGGACCILQNNVLAEPAAGPTSIVILARIVEQARPSPRYRIDAVVIGPELEPLSPRGPPAQNI
jgi:hypothetical protein